MEEAVEKRSNGLDNTSDRNAALKLDQTIRNLRFINDDLHKQLYTLNNRSQNAAEKLGFTSFEDLEDALLNRPDIWNTVVIQHRQGVTLKGDEVSIPRGPEEGSGSDDIILRREFDQLKSEVRMLQERASLTNGLIENHPDSLSPARNPSLTSPVGSRNAEDSNLRFKFDSLARKYDTLLAEREDAERKYREDYKKWKALKLWLFNKSKRGKVQCAQADGKSSRSSLRTEDAFTVENYDSPAFTDDEGAYPAAPRKALSSPPRTSIGYQKAGKGE